MDVHLHTSLCVLPSILITPRPPPPPNPTLYSLWKDELAFSSTFFFFLLPCIAPWRIWQKIDENQCLFFHSSLFSPHQCFRSALACDNEPVLRGSPPWGSAVASAAFLFLFLFMTHWSCQKRKKETVKLNSDHHLSGIRSLGVPMKANHANGVAHITGPNWSRRLLKLLCWMQGTTKTVVFEPLRRPQSHCRESFFLYSSSSTCSLAFSSFLFLILPSESVAALWTQSSHIYEKPWNALSILEAWWCKKLYFSIPLILFLFSISAGTHPWLEFL